MKNHEKVAVVEGTKKEITYKVNKSFTLKSKRNKFNFFKQKKKPLARERNKFFFW